MPRTIIDDWNRISEVLDEAEVLHLAMNQPGKDGPRPYCVPVNFAREGRAIYFHSGLSGRKLELLEADPRVGFTVVSDLGLRKAETACKLGYRFRSVAGTGRVTVIHGEPERRFGMRALVTKWERLSGAQGPLPMDERVFEKSTLVLRIDVGDITMRERD
ncbi:MAG: pyridoxamine 5'-phosphate oxidase family protein [Desulfovibrionaceae bacterium]